MKMLRILSLGLLVVALGCGGGMKPVEGIVKLDGQPLQGATVVFVPDGSKGDILNGFTDASGKFSLLTKGKTGAPAGNYKVVVTKVATSMQPMKPGEDAIKTMAKGPSKDSGAEVPSKYGTADKTPIKVTLPPSESPVKIDLSSK